MNTEITKAIEEIGSARDQNPLPLPALLHLIPDRLPECILSYDFRTYIRENLLLQKKMVGNNAPSVIKQMGPVTHRLMYILNLLKFMDSGGITIGAVETTFGDIASINSVNDLSTILTTTLIKNICLALENATNAQADSDLWHLLRKNMMTASKVKWIGDVPEYHGVPYDGRSFSAAPVCKWTAASLAFGKINEPQVRAAISMFVLGPGYVSTPDGLTDDEEHKFIFRTPMSSNDKQYVEPIANMYNCGLLMDPCTCMVGASMDVLVCDRNKYGLLDPHRNEPSIRIYEIKCRAKYAFCPDEYDNIASSYVKLMKEKSYRAFRQFINSCKSPAVEYVDLDEGYPTVKEALLTTDEDWNASTHLTGALKRKRRPNKCRPGEESIKRHLELNKNLSKSEVWLFGDPKPGDETLTTTHWDNGETTLQVPIFANPRHANFKQVAVQAYVLNRTFCDRKIEPFLATFIGRKRRSSEQDKTYVLVRYSDRPDRTLLDNRYIITPDQSIPVVLIITPLIIENETTTDVLNLAGLKAFSNIVDEVWVNDCLH